MRGIALTALAAGLAAGCVRLLPDPPPAPAIYPLGPPLATTTQAQPAALVIAVGRPNAAPAISGLDVAWMREGRIGYLSRSAWDARMPEALQALVVATIDAQDLARAGIRVGEGPRADYDLRWDVAQFQIVEDGGLEARFAGAMKLVDTRSRDVVAAESFTYSAPLPERRERVAVETLQTLARQGADQIARWAAREAAAHQAAAQPSAASISK